MAETPRFANHLLRTVATGWRIAPIFTASSGGFLSAVIGQDRALDGNANQRANQVLPNVYCANPNPSCYLNLAAFALPAQGTLGDMSPYNIVSPETWNLDTTLSRLLRIREGMNLEVRGEAFKSD